MESELSEQQYQQRNDIRKAMRAQRRNQSLASQEKGSQAVCEKLRALPAYELSKRVATYLAAAGEVDLDPLIQDCWQQRKRVSVPVINPLSAGVMHFYDIHEESALSQNKYGLAEPEVADISEVPPREIQLLCVPLVAFDNTGQRLGMGGGYYDRLLSIWQQGQLPNLFPVGVAFEFQQVDELPSAAWDIPLPMVITPSKLWQF